MKALLLVVCLMLAVAMPANAQNRSADPDLGDTPLLFFGRGLWRMDGSIYRVNRWPQCGDGLRLRPSPDAEWVARANLEGGLQLCNLRTRDSIDVPAPDGIPEGGWASDPAWSPDGTRIAWSLAYVDESEHLLVVYDRETGEARVIVEDVPPTGIKPQVLWGQSGIVVVSDSGDASLSRAPLYSPDGEMLVDDLSNGQYFTLYFWVSGPDGEEYLGRYTNSIHGDLIHPATGDVVFAGEIQQYSPLAPDGLSVTFGYSEDRTFATLPDGTRVRINDLSPGLNGFGPFFTFDPMNIAVSPEGNAFAIFDLDQIIWQDGVVTSIPQQIPSADGTGVIWGPQAFRATELLSPLG